MFVSKHKKKEKKLNYTHRDDAEWLSREICDYYVREASKLKSEDASDVGLRRQLRKELQNRCDILELDALNIINGYHIDDYIRKYEYFRAVLEGSISEDDKKNRKGAYTEEYIEWLAEKEEASHVENADFEIVDEDNY